MAHSAYPELGESAIEKLLDALERVRRAMEVCLKAAGLPTRFTPHSLRQRSARCSSRRGITRLRPGAGGTRERLETVDVYGSWFAVEAPGAVTEPREVVTTRPRLT